MFNEDTPLSLEDPQSNVSKRRIFIKVAFLTGILLLFVAISIATFFAFYMAAFKRQRQIRNVILMIPDGYGPAAHTMSRLTKEDLKLELDKYLVGKVQTHSGNSWVTDSAAAATAYACGKKTFNGAIGVDMDKEPMGTVLEGAIERGYKTGIVVTSTISHATPASFSSHVSNRDYESDIVPQQISKNIDILLGGGREHFLPIEEGGQRTDGRNLFKEAAEKYNYNVVQTAQDFRDDNKRKLPLLGIFSKGHMSFEIDRDTKKQPSLTEMTRAALDLLWKAVQEDENSPGFFILIEGSRIDQAFHYNDAAAAMREAHSFDSAFKVVSEFAKEHPETFVIVTADHETGGLSLGRPLPQNNETEWKMFNWNREPIMNAKASAPVVAELIRENPTKIRQIVEEKYNIRDFSDLEESSLREATGIRQTKEERDKFYASVANIISSRANINWAHLKHTGVDVNLYAITPQGVDFKGLKDNTDIAKAIEKYLGLDLEKITKKLKM